MTAALSSMTGFARIEGADDERRWTWEIKSVNGRGLDFRCRLPSGFDALDPELRKIAKASLSRGSLSINLSMRSQAGDLRYRINREALDDALAMVEHINTRIQCDPSRAEGILGLRGVMETIDNDVDEQTQSALTEALLKSFKDAVKSLDKARRKEGKALASVISDQLDQIDKLAAEAKSLAVAAPHALRDKIAGQLENLLAGAGLPQERLAQEAALLAVKADVREELDRLDAHLAAGRALLQNGGATGRPLDFLTQEFNREANTLCSKAPDMQLKRIGLELKNVIDQMREQVQNVE